MGHEQFILDEGEGEGGHPLSFTWQMIRCGAPGQGDLDQPRVQLTVFSEFILQNWACLEW